jgi:hypothetical protein
VAPKKETVLGVEKTKVSLKKASTKLDSSKSQGSASNKKVN